jgi:hypothetical protein
VPPGKIEPSALFWRLVDAPEISPIASGAEVEFERAGVATGVAGAPLLARMDWRRGVSFDVSCGALPLVTPTAVTVDAELV